MPKFFHQLASVTLELPGSPAGPVTPTKLHNLLQPSKSPSKVARGLSLLSFWHYQENSNVELKVRQERQLILRARIGWKEGKLLSTKTFTKALCERNGIPKVLLMLLAADVNE